MLFLTAGGVQEILSVRRQRDFSRKNHVSVPFFRNRFLHIVDRGSYGAACRFPVERDGDGGEKINHFVVDHDGDIALYRVLFDVERVRGFVVINNNNTFADALRRSEPVEGLGIASGRSYRQIPDNPFGQRISCVLIQEVDRIRIGLFGDGSRSLQPFVGVADDCLFGTLCIVVTDAVSFADVKKYGVGISVLEPVGTVFFGKIIELPCGARGFLVPVVACVVFTALERDGRVV